jgi:hypothetical protein
MARATANQWAQAKALYEAGESLRDISEKTKIDNSNISKRAKKEGWERGILPQIAKDKARILIEKKGVDEKITALLPHQREIVENAVIDMLSLSNYFHDAGKEVAEIALQALREEPTSYNAKATMEALKAGRIVTGLDAMHASAAVINNQQNSQAIIEGEATSVSFIIESIEANHDASPTL